MALVDNIANASLRDADRIIATAVDKLAPVDTQSINALAVVVADLRSEVRALNIAINGEPAPSESPSAPTAPEG